MTKELLEIGIPSVISHQCQECKGGSEQHQLQLCLLCSLTHKQQHPNHELKQILQKA